MNEAIAMEYPQRSLMVRSQRKANASLRSPVLCKPEAEDTNELAKRGPSIQVIER